MTRQIPDSIPSVPRFLFSVASPRGDIPVADPDFHMPLEGCALRTTYGAYFRAIQAALTRDDCTPLWPLLQDACHCSLPAQIHVRAEKHGALYHPASLELTWQDGSSRKYALLVATTNTGQDALRREGLVLRHLQDASSQMYLPRNLGMMEHDAMSFLLAPWFSGYHEFHVDQNGAFSLWDHDLGVRPIPDDLARQVSFQAARVLTLYLDAQSGACIHPWSHAAGDFIVRMDDCGVDIRLSTARGHDPFVPENPLSSMFAFFLDLALRIRMDRVDGVGEWVWLDRSFLAAAIDGFLTAVSERGAEETLPRTLSRVLPSFSWQELLDGHASIVDGFSANEIAVMMPRLEVHCRELAGMLSEIKTEA